ncbi:hypothetical protein ASG33_19120 [Dyadobacter sp. Leaf189]|nr:hypothetical protein ASG33_19120 [Dyadobacter sp. Leaf189]
MNSKLRSSGLGNECPPDEDFVRVYFLQQGSTIMEAVKFFDHYEAKRWSNSDDHVLKNWKRLAWTWIFY